MTKPAGASGQLKLSLICEHSKMLSSMNILPRSPGAVGGRGWMGGDSTTLGPGLLLSLLPLSSPLLSGFVWPYKSSLPAPLPRSLLCQASDSLPAGRPTGPSNKVTQCKSHPPRLLSEVSPGAQFHEIIGGRNISDKKDLKKKI